MKCNKRCKTNSERVYDWLKLGENKPSPSLIFKLLLEEMEELASGIGREEYDNYLEVMIEEVVRMKKKLANNEIQREFNEDLVLDSIADVEVVLHNFTYLYELVDKYQEHFDLVMSSNESKYCDNEEDALESVEAYREGTHFDKLGSIIECDYKQVGGKYVIFRVSDGKIMKSIKYNKI